MKNKKNLLIIFIYLNAFTMFLDEACVFAQQNQRRSRRPMGRVQYEQMSDVLQNEFHNEAGGDEDAADVLSEAVQGTLDMNQILGQSTDPSAPAAEVCHFGVDSNHTLLHSGLDARGLSARMSVRDRCHPDQFYRFVCDTRSFELRRARQNSNYFRVARRVLTDIAAELNPTDFNGRTEPRPAPGLTSYIDLETGGFKRDGSGQVPAECRTTSSRGAMRVGAISIPEGSGSVTIQRGAVRNPEMPGCFGDANPCQCWQFRLNVFLQNNVNTPLFAQRLMQHPEIQRGMTNAREDLAQLKRNLEQEVCNRAGGPEQCGSPVYQAMIRNIRNTQLAIPTVNTCIGDDDNVTTTRAADGSIRIFACPRALLNGGVDRFALRGALASALGHALDSCSLENIYAREGGGGQGRSLEYMGDGLRACLAQNYLPHNRRGDIDGYILGESMVGDGARRRRHCTRAPQLEDILHPNTQRPPGEIVKTNDLEAQYWGMRALSGMFANGQGQVDASRMALTDNDFHEFENFCDGSYSHQNLHILTTPDVSTRQQAGLRRNCRGIIGRNASGPFGRYHHLRNALQSYCVDAGRSGYNPYDSHPPARQMLALAAANPAVQEMLGCQGGASSRRHRRERPVVRRGARAASSGVANRHRCEDPTSFLAEGVQRTQQYSQLRQIPERPASTVTASASAADTIPPSAPVTTPAPTTVAAAAPATQSSAPVVTPPVVAPPTPRVVRVAAAPVIRRSSDGQMQISCRETYAVPALNRSCSPLQLTFSDGSSCNYACTLQGTQCVCSSLAASERTTAPATSAQREGPQQGSQALVPGRRFIVDNMTQVTQVLNGMASNSPTCLGATARCGQIEILNQNGLPLRTFDTPSAARDAGCPQGLPCRCYAAVIPALPDHENAAGGANVGARARHFQCVPGVEAEPLTVPIPSREVVSYASTGSVGVRRHNLLLFPGRTIPGAERHAPLLVYWPVRCLRDEVSCTAQDAFVRERSGRVRPLNASEQQALNLELNGSQGGDSSVAGSAPAPRAQSQSTAAAAPASPPTAPAANSRGVASPTK